MSHHHKITFATLPTATPAAVSPSAAGEGFVIGRSPKATIITIIAVILAVSIMSVSTGYLGEKGVGVSAGDEREDIVLPSRHTSGIHATRTQTNQGGAGRGIAVPIKAEEVEEVQHSTHQKDIVESSRSSGSVRGGEHTTLSEEQGKTVDPQQRCRESPLLHFPLSPIEHELVRLADLTRDVMAALNATYWPADATLLGLMRSGRVATDRDLDFSIHATFETCWSVLGSIRNEFVKRGAKVKYFKVATTKSLLPEGVRFGGGIIDASAAKSRKFKIGRYAMVRVVREHGDFDTGPDFNCVYTDDPRGPSFFTHKGVLTVLPQNAVYPLGTCLMYNRTIPCPRDGVAFLGTLTPRYDGCLVYPHCMGRDPSKSHRDCLTPHPHREDLSVFVDSTRMVDSCGYVSMVKHFEESPQCKKTLVPTCDEKRGLCFIQPFVE